MKAEEIRAEFQEIYKDLFANKVLREVHKGNGISFYVVAEKFWAIIPFMDKLPEQAYLLLTVNDEEARSVIFNEKKFGEIFEDRKKREKMFVLTPETKQCIYNIHQKRMEYGWSELFAFLVAAGVPLIWGWQLIVKNKEDELKMWELKKKKILPQDKREDWHLQLREMPTFWTIYCVIVFGLVIYHLFQIWERDIWDIGVVIVCAVVFVLIWGFVFSKQTKDMEITLRRLFTVKEDVWGEHFVALDLKEKKIYMVYHRFEDESDDNPSEKYGFQEISEEQMRQLAREHNVEVEEM